MDEPFRFTSKQQRVEPEMDMTPMVDVTFLLLIFFMVTASFTMQKSFQMPTPKSDQPSSTRTVEDFEEDPSFVVVRIDEFNTFHVAAAAWEDEEEAPTRQDLLIRLRRARESSSGRGGATRMLVMAHGDATHEKVVTAIDAGNDVGMDDVKLVTMEEDTF